jgi:hypothetical protein
MHLILDNYGRHKTARIRRWFARHRRFPCPSHADERASWLNVVESWFALLNQKQIKRSAHRVRALETAIATTWRSPTTRRSHSSGRRPLTRSAPTWWDCVSESLARANSDPPPGANGLVTGRPTAAAYAEEQRSRLRRAARAVSTHGGVDCHANRRHCPAHRARAARGDRDEQAPLADGETFHVVPDAPPGTDTPAGAWQARAALRQSCGRDPADGCDGRRAHDHRTRRVLSPLGRTRSVSSS